MTPNPRTVQPQDTLQVAAQAMDALNVGVLPVTEGGRLVGVVTDRDIVVRSTSAGQDPKAARVAEAMTLEPMSMTPDASTLDALRLMEEHQLRRLPILDEDGRLVGIVSLGDLAAAGTPEAGDALEVISTPAEPDR
ncbi:MAG TPA: CBS domain-containing protein [Acetobacteraceae bacterium]|nr:CBS domain-containing protein [Acetobacteraceae bacterium]